MTYTDAKQELMSCRFIQYNINLCKEKIRQLDSELVFTSSVIRRPVAQSPAESRADKIRYKLDEEIRKYDELIEDLSYMQNKLESRIFDVHMENPLYGELLKMRYIFNKKLEERT